MTHSPASKLGEALDVEIEELHASCEWRRQAQDEGGRRMMGSSGVRNGAQHVGVG